MWLITSILVASTVFVGAYFTSDRRFLRAFERLPATPIAQVRHGELVKVIGRLEHLLPPLSAPISGRACAYYHVLALERGGSGLVEERKQDFLVRAHDGQCALVRMAASEPLAPEDAHYFSATFRGGQLTAEMARLLERHGRGAASSPAIDGEIERDWSFTERLFQAGDTVAVVGRAGWQLDASEASGSYREAPRRLVIGDGVTPVRVTNHPSVATSTPAKPAPTTSPGS